MFLDLHQQSVAFTHSFLYTLYRDVSLFSSSEKKTKTSTQTVDMRQRGKRVYSEKEGLTESRCVLPPTVEGYLQRHLR